MKRPFHNPRTGNFGVTLIEVLVASAIALILMTVMWGLFSGGMKQFFKTQEHLEAMQVAQLALEFIENDLHAMIVLDKNTPTLLDNPNPRSNIEFYASRGDQASGGIYRGAKISYGTTPIDGTPYFYFVRNGKVLYNMPLKKLWFEPIEYPALDDTPNKSSTKAFLRVTVTAMDSRLNGEFTLIGLTALDMLCLRKRNPHWQQIPVPYIRLEQ